MSHRPSAKALAALDASDVKMLERMLVDTLEAQSIIGERHADAVAADRACGLALERLLQRIADDAARVSAHGRALHPNLPWARLETLAGTVSTAQDRIDSRVLYAIVVREAPGLVDALRGAVNIVTYD